MARCVDEPPEEFVTLFDFKTGKRIICTNKSNVKENEWIDKLSRTVDGEADKQAPFVLDVRAPIPFLSERVAFDWDSFVAPNNVDRFCMLLVAYSTFIHCQLKQPDVSTIVVFCDNGRSRSPNVLVAFFMIFRGLTYPSAISWLRESFHAQRPCIAAASPEFPNFSKFWNLMQRLSGMLAQKEGILYRQIAYVAEKFYLRCSKPASPAMPNDEKFSASSLSPGSSSANECGGNSTRSSDIVRDSKVSFETLWNTRATPKNMVDWPQKSICNITPTTMTQEIDLDVFKRSKRQRKEVKRYEISEDGVRKRSKIDGEQDGSTSVKRGKKRSINRPKINCKRKKVSTESKSALGKKKNRKKDAAKRKKNIDAARKSALLVKENSLTGRLRLFAEILVDNYVLKTGCTVTLRTRRSEYSGILGDMGTVRVGKKVHSSIENWVRRCLNRVDGLEDMVFYKDKSLRSWVELVQNGNAVEAEKIPKERYSDDSSLADVESLKKVAKKRNVVPSAADPACKDNDEIAGDVLDEIKSDVADENVAKPLGGVVEVVRDASIEAEKAKPKDSQATTKPMDARAVEKIAVEMIVDSERSQVCPNVDQCDKISNLGSQCHAGGEVLVDERREASSPYFSGWYTKEEFLVYYGGYDEWDAACSVQQDDGGGNKYNAESRGKDKTDCSPVNLKGAKGTTKNPKKHFKKKGAKQTREEVHEEVRKKYGYPHSDIMAMMLVEKQMQNRVATVTFKKKGFGLRLRQSRAVVVSWVDPYRESLSKVKKGMKLLRVGPIDVDETTSLSTLARVIQDYYAWKKPLLTDFVDTNGFIVSVESTTKTLGLRLMIWNRLIVDEVNPLGQSAGKVFRGMYISAIDSHNFCGTFDEFKRIVNSASSFPIRVQFVGLNAHQNYLHPKDCLAHFFSPRLGVKKQRRSKNL